MASTCVDKFSKKKEWIFPTHTFQDFHGLQTVEEYWAKHPELNKSLIPEPDNVKKVLTQHAGFSENGIRFWKTRTDLLTNLAARRVKCEMSYKEEYENLVRDIWKFLEELFAENQNVEFVGDNLAFDLGILDGMIDSVLGETIRLHPLGYYIQCCSIYDWMKGLLHCTRRMDMNSLARRFCQTFSLAQVSKPVSHEPLEDCQYVLNLVTSILQFQTRTITGSAFSRY